MKRIILLLIGIVFLVLLNYPVTGVSENNLFISVIMDYNHGRISFQEPHLIQSTEILNKEEKTGNYTLKVYSFKKEILYETKISFDLMLFGAPLEEWFDKDGNQIIIPNETDTLTRDNVSQTVFIPYFKTAKMAMLYDENNIEVASIDISKFAVCNQNGVCDSKETKELCLEDCSNTNSTQKSMSFWQRIIATLKSLFGK